MRVFKIDKYALLLLTTILFLVFSCTREFDDLELATFPGNGDVFLDDFSGGLQYAAFAGSKILAFEVDGTEGYESRASMRFAVPELNDPEGGYAGGQFFVDGGRNLTKFNALTFWARASQTANIDVLGFGNIEEATIAVSLSDVKVNTNWQQFIIPIPDPSKLLQEKSLFFYSEGPEDGDGYTFWIDEVQFERIEDLTNPRATMFQGAAEAVTAETGDSIRLTGELNVTHNLPNGLDQTTDVAPGAYFEYTSSNPSVATVTNGVVVVLDAGTTVITATMAGEAVEGSLTVESTGDPLLPPTVAPTPTVDPDSVISMFSNAYENVPVDTWNPFWEFSTAEVQDVKIGNDDLKRYKTLNFVGILTESNQIDASEMTHFHMDIWTPDPTVLPAAFNVLLVDFGANGTFDGGDDSSQELAFTSPTLKTGEWVSLDIPLSDFTGLTNRKNIAQLVLSGDLPNVFVDNVYYYKTAVSPPATPAAAAPTPDRSANDVVSLFSDAYDNVPVDTWRTDWSVATFEDVEVAGNAMKKYSNLDFVGVETVANPVDASDMTTLHLDVWSPDFNLFGVKLVDFGADGAFGGGDDVEHQIDIPMLAQEEWVSLDLSLDDFTGLTSRSNIAQYILVGQPTGATTVYVDNIYFYNENGGGTGAMEPIEAAPMPTQEAANVVSLFSDAYDNLPVDTWRTDWSAATFEDVEVAGNSTKKYSNLDFVGVETVSNTIDASAMSHLHVDLWSADYTFFGIKLVDFGADGAFGGGDDVEHQISYEMPQQGDWWSLDIPLEDFTGLTTRANIAQYILVGQPTGATTVYVDNMYFYGEGSGVATEPTEAAPTPTQDSGDVVSLFSDAYDNVGVDTWRTDWSAATLEDVEVAGNATKKYSNLDFVGIETVSGTVDASEMTHLHLDVWSPDYTFFGIKLVDFGPDGAFGGGDDVEHQINFDMPLQGDWWSLDIPLEDFTGLTTRSNIAQYILVGQPTGATTVYVDNMYFYK